MRQRGPRVRPHEPRLMLRATVHLCRLKTDTCSGRYAQIVANSGMHFYCRSVFVVDDTDHDGPDFAIDKVSACLSAKARRACRTLAFQWPIVCVHFGHTTPPSPQGARDPARLSRVAIFALLF